MRDEYMIPDVNPKTYHERKDHTHKRHNIQAYPQDMHGTVLSEQLTAHYRRVLDTGTDCGGS